MHIMTRPVVYFLTAVAVLDCIVFAVRAHHLYLRPPPQDWEGDRWYDKAKDSIGDAALAAICATYLYRRTLEIRAGIGRNPWRLKENPELFAFFCLSAGFGFVPICSDLVAGPKIRGESIASAVLSVVTVIGVVLRRRWEAAHPFIDLNRC
jgi:hypothetical protein